MTLVAVTCGADDWPKVVAMTDGMSDWLAQYVDMSSGVPCERTLVRVCRTRQQDGKISTETAFLYHQPKLRLQRPWHAGHQLWLVILRGENCILHQVP